MDLKQLRYFIGICDAGSITRAAKVLHVAQPALSNHISNLEAQLKVELLHRTSHGVIPTESGEILYASAHRVLREMSRIADEVNALKNKPAGKVAIGVAAGISNIFGMRFIKQMTKHYPDISLAYSSGLSPDLYRKLLTGILDIGMFYKEPEIGGVSSRKLLREELFVAMQCSSDRPPCNEAISIAELRRLPFVFPRTDHFSMRSIVENVFSEAGFAPQIVAEVESFTTIKQLVADGFACTIAPWSSTYEEVEKKIIKLRPIEGISITRYLELCMPLDRPLAISITVARQMTIKVIEDLISTGQWPHVSLVETGD
ncbi:MAG: LysR family transcriptional regulator [Gammaproteobacteria bacterium]|nr:LysR family transcriptional regulator [Gammaproteobacteria bacterium]